jgi:hypothetical protein
MVSILCVAQAPVPEPVTDQETELGQAVYNELRDKGEIIESSPLYESLRPVAESISRVAQSRYPHPSSSSWSTNPIQMHSRPRVGTST